jgi:hypothetical protein
MPIDVNLLREPINRCIIIPIDRLVHEALHELQLAGGESWWHLVVDLGGGRFAAAQFLKLTPLAESERNRFFNRPLSSLVESGIPLVSVVEQAKIGTQAAKDKADESPGRVLVVTQADQFLGIIYRGEAGGVDEGTPLLSLFDQYVADIRSHTAGGGTHAKPPPDRARYIQAQVSEPVASAVHLPVGAPLLADHPYALDVRISPPDPQWLGPPPEGVFPDDELPETDTYHSLQVVFYAPFHAPQPQVQTLQLPVRGASDPVRFNFRTLPDRTDFEARIVMLYENRILQTALLRSRVLIPGNPVMRDGEAGLHLVIEAVVRDRLDGLESEPAFGASLVLNHSPAGESSMQAFAGENALVIQLGGVKPLIDDIKNLLGAIYRSPQNFEDGLWGNATQQLLWGLAHKGRDLYESLLQFQNLADHPLIQASRLQIVTTNVASFLPLEYIYDRLAPRLIPPAPLCPNAADALRDGQCQCNLADESEAVCPLGFWGMRKVIERFAFERPAQAQSLQGDEFKIFAGVNGGYDELVPFSQVLFAASDKVDEDHDHPHQIQAVLDTLQRVSGNKTRQVFDWTHWRDEVEQDGPSLLVLLPHHTITTINQLTIHGLEISQDQTRYYPELRSKDVQPQGSMLRPLVLLLGCETMSTDIPYESFVAKFLSLGAAIVLGTTTSVFGFHAAPVACKISEIMQALIAQGASSFADIMLRLRRQAMLEGYPMALTLFAYGDAGWVLTPAPD